MTTLFFEAVQQTKHNGRAQIHLKKKKGKVSGLEHPSTVTIPFLLKRVIFNPKRCLSPTLACTFGSPLPHPHSQLLSAAVTRKSSPMYEWQEVFQPCYRAACCQDNDRTTATCGGTVFNQLKPTGNLHHWVPDAELLNFQPTFQRYSKVSSGFLAYKSSRSTDI